MGRLLAIDYGSKKTGLAVSDPLQIAVSPLATVPTGDLLGYLATYLEQEPVERFIIGDPRHKDGTPVTIHQEIVGLGRKLARSYPHIPQTMQDEFGTSQEAREMIRNLGVSRKKRRDKQLVDRVAAVLILRAYLDEQHPFSPPIT
ncbi:MAG: Holliday junction resolvase RuvX [Saprospiraceae bacterium]